VEVLERPSVLVAVDRLRRGVADNRPRESVHPRRSTPARV
jgi:hypothetical protein